MWRTPSSIHLLVIRISHQNHPVTVEIAMGKLPGYESVMQ